MPTAATANAVAFHGTAGNAATCNAAFLATLTGAAEVMIWGWGEG